MRSLEKSGVKLRLSRLLTTLLAFLNPSILQLLYSTVTSTNSVVRLTAVLATLYLQKLLTKSTVLFTLLTRETSWFYVDPSIVVATLPTQQCLLVLHLSHLHNRELLYYENPIQCSLNPQRWGLFYLQIKLSKPPIIIIEH